jgi:hypothetical protein
MQTPQKYRGQPYRYRGPVSITTPYQQPPSAKNQHPPVPPTGRVRGLRRAGFYFSATSNKPSKTNQIADVKEREYIR